MVSGFLFCDLAVFCRPTNEFYFPSSHPGKVQFFKLPSARPPLVIFNRNEHFNEETGTLLYDHAKIPLDLYSPVKCVQTKEVRGSCRDFKARQDVTEQVVKFTSFRELLQADGEEGLGEDLSAIVAVASQKLRAEAKTQLKRAVSRLPDHLRKPAVPKQL